MMTAKPDLFWALVASMFIGNVMLVVINLPMLGIWVRLLGAPYRFMYPTILMLCVVGVYATTAEPFQIVMMVIFAAFGYVLLKFGCEPVPLVLGFILGPLMEVNLRRSLQISRGDPIIFFDRPISATLLAIAAGMILLAVLPSFRRTREEAFKE
jgi:TctA family transporter